MPLSSYPYGKEERKTAEEAIQGYPLLNKIFILFNYVWRKKPSIPPVFSARFARCDHAILLTFHTVT